MRLVLTIAKLSLNPIVCVVDYFVAEYIAIAATNMQSNYQIWCCDLNVIGIIIFHIILFVLNVQIQTGVCLLCITTNSTCMIKILEHKKLAVKGHFCKMILAVECFIVCSMWSRFW